VRAAGSGRSLRQKGRISPFPVDFLCPRSYNLDCVSKTKYFIGKRFTSILYDFFDKKSIFFDQELKHLPEIFCGADEHA
jgi:hypothetical protein